MPLLLPLSYFFGLIVFIRRKRYQAANTCWYKKASYRASVPVIIVGNISVGGNGKTPVVIWLALQLQQQGYKVGVVSRGYKSQASSYPLIVNKQTRVTECGDEPKLIYDRTNAIIAIDPNRVNAVKKLEQLQVDIIISDDGMQYYALERDLEIAVIDAERMFGDHHLLPLGPLREKIIRLQEVEFKILNNSNNIKLNKFEGYDELLKDQIIMNLQPAKAVNISSGECIDAQDLGSVVAIAAIGNPERFFNTLKSLGVDVQEKHKLADHEHLALNKLKQLAIKDVNLIMTEKDAVKCKFELGSDLSLARNWWYLPVDAQFDPQDAIRMLNTIKEVKATYGS